MSGVLHAASAEQLRAIRTSLERIVASFLKRARLTV
jgi:hypothetical protein